MFMRGRMYIVVSMIYGVLAWLIVSGTLALGGFILTHLFYE